MHLNENDVAERLKLSIKTLQNWRSLGKGPPFYKLGSRVVYNDADIDNWLAGQHRNSTSQLQPALESSQLRGISVGDLGIKPIAARRTRVAGGKPRAKK